MTIRIPASLSGLSVRFPEASLADLYQQKHEPDGDLLVETWSIGELSLVYQRLNHPVAQLNPPPVSSFFKSRLVTAGGK